jgi:hypothetical protein
MEVPNAMKDRYTLTRRQLLKRAALYTPIAYAALGHRSPAYGADIVAANASQAAVQAAVNAASDGGRVLIPNGSATWTGGIATAKQIIIRAQNYTPAPGGTGTRTVTITNNSSQPLIHMTSGNSSHCGVGGIRFNEGTGGANHVRFSGSGSKVPLLFDCYFQVKQRNGSATDVSVCAWLSQGGVAWNCVWSSQGFSGGSVSPVGTDGACILIHSPRAWSTPSTMGSLDLGGVVNWYIEDSTMLLTGQGPDTDDNGRVVVRHCNLDGAWGLTHGFTSLFGGRHFEYYDNIFSVTNGNRNMAGRYFWCRAGTGIFTNNVVNNASNPSEWGNPVQLDIGDNTSPGSYPMARQPGFGASGRDPIYIWNQSGARGYTFSFQGSWGNIVQLNRDIFVNSGPKPGYSKFTYPHPLRSAVEDGSPPSAPPAAPTGLTIG